MYLSKNDIDSLNRTKRINIINSITGIKSANLIGTISAEGISNLAIFSSVIHLGSSPALLGFVLRPVSRVRRDTFNNIIKNNFFTINHVHKDFVESAHLTSKKFKSAESEFKHCNLTEYFLDGFTAPFVKESNVGIGLKLVETIEVKSNNCIIMIGSIEHLLVPNDMVSIDGHIDLQNLNTIGVNGLDTYYELKDLINFPYLKGL